MPGADDPAENAAVHRLLNGRHDVDTLPDRRREGPSETQHALLATTPNCLGQDLRDR